MKQPEWNATDLANSVPAKGTARVRPSRIYLALILLAALLLGGVAQAQTIRRVSAPKFYVDDKLQAGVPAGIIYNYAVYAISNNTATTFPGLYVTITNIASTNRVKLTTTDTGVRALGELAPGETKLAAFYLKGPSFTGNSDTLTGLTNETHTIRILNGPVGVGSTILSQTFGFTNIIFAIEALANKVTIITNLNPNATLGSEVPLVITGDTGTIGGENSVAFSPAVLGGWRPDCYELVRSIVKFTENPTYTNQIYFDPNITGFTNFTGQSYTNTFIFRAVKPTITNISISPFAFVDSGSGTKHTAFSSLANSGGSNVIYSATNVLSIVNQTATPTSIFAPGGTVTYSITFSNFGPEAIDMDEVIDQLPGTPGNATYIPGSATFKAAPLADPVIVGQALHWALPFTINSNSTAVLTFQAVIPAPSGQYTNSVVALLGPTQIDTTTDTTDNSPSRSVVTIIPVSDLAVGKSAPANVNAAANFSYTISVTNFGPSPTTLSVTDNLPAQVSFVSATPTATLNGSQVVWSLGALASNAVTNLTITVTAPSEAASLTNSASAGSSTIDPNSTNNVAPPVFTTVSPLANLAISKAVAGSVLPGSNFNYTITVTNIGPSTAVSVTVTDALPANVTFVSASAGGVFGSGNVVWSNLGNLAGGVSTNLTLTVTAPIKGSITNVASTSSSTSDPTPGNNTTPPVTTSVSNLPPLAVNDTASTPRNVSVTVPVLVNDSDPNGDTLALVGVTQTNGTASVSGTNVVFTPATNFLGTVVLSYTVIDGIGGTNSATITVSVTNRPPVAVNDSVFGTNGIAQTIYPLTNDSDPDGNPLTITTATAPSGILAINAGSTNLTFTPTNANTVVITYSVSDGFGGTNTATITVIGQNTSPVANDDSVSTPANTPLLVSPLINDSDLDANPLTITFVSPTNGTASIVNGTNVFFTPTTNFDGTATVLYTISDGQGGTDSAIITITVTPVADLAVAKSALSSVVAGANFNYTISVTNFGPSTVTSLSVTDSLPAAVSFVSALPAATVNGSEVVWTLGSLASGAATNLTLTVTAPANGSNLTNSANVGSPTSDPTSTNNTTPPVFTTVTPLADVAVTKTGPVAPVLPGANFNYTIVVTNLGPSTAASLSVTDALPANVAFVSASGGGVFSSGQVVWSLGNLTANGSTNLTLTVTAPSRGGITNTANINSPTGDPNPTNNVTPPVTSSVSNLPPVAVSDIASTTRNVPITVPVLVNDSDPNGDPLTIISANTTNGTANVSGTNVVFTPAPNFVGTVVVIYTIIDGSGGTNSATITVTVNNASPVANNDSFTTLEDTTLNIPAGGVLTNDVDADGDALSALLVSTTANGSLTLNANGSFNYTPSTNFNGGDSFTYRAVDGSATSGVATVTINITPVNDAPIALNDTTNTLEDVSVTVNVLVNDSDPEGTPLAITGTSTTNGVIINTGTNLVFTPSTNFNGIVIFSYTVSDGTNTATANVTIIIGAVDDAPVANNDAFSLFKNATLTIPAAGVLTNDTDVENDPLSALLVANVTQGTLALNTNGGFVYTPVSNYVGSDSFTYRAYDSGATGSIATVTLTILATNTAPFANNDTFTTLEDTTLNIPTAGVLTNDVDVDGDALSALLVSTTTQGSLTLNANGSFTYTPNTNFNGNDSFTYRARDGQATGNVATVAISITPVNDSPIAVNDFTNTLEDVSVTISVLANDSDPEGTPLTITGTNTTNGTAIVSGTTVVFTPGTNFNGTALFSYTVSDGTNSATANVTVTVGAVDDAPVTVNDSYGTLKNIALNVGAPGVLGNDTDVENNPLSALLVANPTNGTLTLNANGSFLYTPASNYVGSDVFTYRAYDAGATGNIATVTINVGATNTAPVASNDAFVTLEDTTLTIPAAGILTNDVDFDGDSLTVLLVGTTTQGSLTFNANGSFTYTPNTNFNGSDSFTYRARDGQATGNVATVTINITPVNDAPIAVNDTASSPEDVPVTITALTNDSDPEGTLLSIIGTTTTNGTAVVSGTNIVFTPSTNFFGTVVFSYTISDGTNTATAFVTVTVNPVNDAPVTVNDSFNTLKNIPMNIAAPGVLANDTDVETNTLSALLVSSTTNGALTLNANGSFLYTPSSNYVGSDVFTYRAYDFGATGNVATVTINIGATNTPSIANPQTVSTVQNAPKAITLTGSDPDGDPLTFNVATSPANGSLSGLDTNTGAITYTPNATFVGTDSFTFRVNDGTTNSVPATFTINVTAQSDLAVFKTGSTNGGAGTNLSFTITVTNLGPSTASNVTVFDQLPASYTFVSAVPSPAIVAGGLVRWPSFNLPALSSSNFSLTVTPSSGGVFTNIAYATNSTPDPDPTNNNGTSTNSQVTTLVIPLADLAVFKTGPASVTSGANVTYTITLTNRGPSIATNAVATDALPAGATFQSASGSFTFNSGIVTWAGITLTNGASATYTTTVTAPLTGSMTNTATGSSSTPDPDPTNNNGTGGGSKVTTAITPIADIAIGKNGLTNVTPGQTFVYTISVTNLGPVAAANVIVQDLLPTNLTFISASGGGVFATNVVTWPTIASLANGAINNLTVTVTAPGSGNFTNIALATSSTSDPNPANNDGSDAGSRVAGAVVAAPFGVLKGPNILNPQTGLFEQRVTVTNTGASTVAAFQVLVGNINGTNGVPRTNVTLVNATGTNVDSRPYVQYNSPLNPGSNVTLILEFFVPDRKPFTNSLEVIAVLPSSAGTNAGAGVVIDRAFMDLRFAEPRFVIEWTSVPGRTYTVIYSDVSASGPWSVATPTVTAPNNRVQWYDDGPPKTSSKPASVNSRYYRVIANP